MTDLPYLLTAMFARSVNGMERSQRNSRKLEGGGVGGRGRSMSIPRRFTKAGRSLAR